MLYPQQAWRCADLEVRARRGRRRAAGQLLHEKTLYPDGDDDGAPITQHPSAKKVTAPERWRFVPVSENLYRIEHVSSGKVLSVTADRDVTIEGWSEADSQKWKLLDKPASFTG